MRRYKRLFEDEENMNGILPSATAERIKNSLQGFYDDIDNLTTYTDYKALCKRGYAIMDKLDGLKESIGQMLEMYNPEILDRLVDAFIDYINNLDEFYNDLDIGYHNSTKKIDNYSHEFSECLEEYDLSNDWYVKFDNLNYYINGIYDDQRSSSGCTGGAIELYTGNLDVEDNEMSEKEWNEFYEYQEGEYQTEVWKNHPLVFSFKNDDLNITYNISLNEHPDKFKSIYRTFENCAVMDKTSKCHTIWLPDLPK